MKTIKIGSRVKYDRAYLQKIKASSFVRSLVGTVRRIDHNSQEVYVSWDAVPTTTDHGECLTFLEEIENETLPISNRSAE